MIHERVASDASRLVRIVGSATLTIVASSRDMNIPMRSTPSARFARRGLAPAMLDTDVVSDMARVLSGQSHIRDVGGVR